MESNRSIYHCILGTTVNGNDVTDYAAIYEIIVYGYALATGDARTFDKFGIKKIYSSKTNGQQWYLGDPGLITGGVGMEKVRHEANIIRVSHPSDRRVIFIGKMPPE